MTLRDKFITPIDPDHFSIDDKVIVWAYINMVLVLIMFILSKM
jgi:hypothetical protein